MSGIEFSNADELTGIRQEIAEEIVKYIRENGPQNTAKLRDELYEEFAKDDNGDDGYGNEQSFHRTLGYIRPIMVKNDLVETERVPSDGSRMTWKWSLP